MAVSRSVWLFLFKILFTANLIHALKILKTHRSGISYRLKSHVDSNLDCMKNIHSISCDRIENRLIKDIFRKKKLMRITTIVSCVASLGLGSPNIAFAAGRTASEAFLKSEEAVEKSQKEYRKLDTEWKTGKALINTNFAQIKKSINIVQGVERDLKTQVERLEKLNSVGKSSIDSLNIEISVLTDSTAAKYAKAEASSAALDKPSKTADLFRKAQNEAAILGEDKKILQSLIDADKIQDQILVKAKDILSVMKSLLSEAQLSQNDQVEALALMQSGVDSNKLSCYKTINGCAVNGKSGSNDFKSGKSKIQSAQKRFGTVFQQLEADVKALTSLTDQLERENSKFGLIRDNNKKFEEDTKLSTKAGKKALSSFGGDLNSVFNSFDQKAKYFSKQILDVKGKDVKEKKSKKSFLSEVSTQINVVSDKLDSSWRQASSAERLFLDARKEGDKESAKYLKNYNPNPIPSSSTTQSQKAPLTSNSPEVTQKEVSTTAVKSTPPTGSAWVKVRAVSK